MTRNAAALAALAFAAASLWTWAVFDARSRPFALALVPTSGPVRNVRVWDLDPVRARRLAPSPVARAEWRGHLELGAGETDFEVTIAADSATSIAFGERPPLEHAGRPGRVTGTFRLGGATAVTITHALREAGETHLRITLAPPGVEPRRLETLGSLRSPWLQRARPWAGGAALLSALAGLGLLARGMRAASPETAARVRRRAVHAAALLVTVYGALLRVEALASKYPEAPAWMTDLVPVARSVHPPGMRWIPPEHPHQGDPFSYLRLARDMRGFYQPSVREPVFVWVVGRMLRLVGGGDVAVSAASALFSVLLIPATYLLGLAAFSPGVGLAAAAAVAVERQMIGLGVDGWRDDAFAVFVVLSAAALLRLHDRPSWTRSLPAGLVLGLALLTRITSLSFLLPALALVAFAGRAAPRRRLLQSAAAAGLAALLVAPFLVACARAYGDPLYSINAHTRFYRSRAAGAPEVATAWHSFLLEGRGPLGLLDTGLVGLTWYAFTNKWEHFDYLATWVGPALAAAAIAGLLLWLAAPRGRLLLVMLLASLLPYAFTWDIPGGSEWRFTLHAYPLYLVAAASAPTLALSWLRGLREAWTARRRRTAWLAAGAAATLAVGYVGLCGLAWARVREDLAAGRPATVAVGPRDLFFFGAGWSRPRRAGHVFVRRAEAEATMRLPLPAGRPYRLALRLDAGAPAMAAVSVNGAPVAELSLTPDDLRFGRHEVDVPLAPLRAGANVLRIRATSPFALWLVHIGPAPPAAGSTGH